MDHTLDLDTHRHSTRRCSIRDAFRIGEEEAKPQHPGSAPRSGPFRCARGRFDVEARFPTENYQELREHGLLAICVPREHGGLGADYRAYLPDGRRDRSLLWSDGPDLEHPRLLRACGPAHWPIIKSTCVRTSGAIMTGAAAPSHYARIVNDGAIYSQPFSEGGGGCAPAPYRSRPRPAARTAAGG